MDHREELHCPTYGCGDTALLRVAALPAARADRTRNSPEGDPDADIVALRAYIREILADTQVREAVAVASASLARAAERIAAGEGLSEARVRRVAGALSRYLIRMSTRPTPFGLMAGVATAGLGGGATARLGRRHRKDVRPDAVWLIPLLTRLEQRPEVWPLLHLTVNDLSFVRGDRLVLPYVPDTSGGRPFSEDVTEVTLRHTAPVAAALRYADRPVTGAELRARLAAQFPSAPGPAVDGLITQLIGHDVLLTDLRPPSPAPDPLAHVLARLRIATGDALPELAVLEEVHRAVRTYAAEPCESGGNGLGGGEAARAATVGLMTTLHVTDRPLHVDLAVDAEVCLPDVVAREAERAADVLWRLAPGDGEPMYLRQYRADFLERYGLGRLVPVKELLNPDVGLGAPAGYRHPVSGRTAEPRSDARRDGSARERVLAALVTRAQRAATQEIVLDAGAVERMEQPSDTDEPLDRSPLPSMELCGRVVSAGLREMTTGDFTLWLSQAGGSRQVGAMSGRFAHLLGADALRVLQSAPKDKEGEGPLAAQLHVQGAWLPAANLTRVPRALERQIVVGGYADRGDPHVIGLSDIAVGAWPDRLVLVDQRSGLEVLPATFHMLNMRAHAPNLARFLQEITLSGRRSWEPWYWGALEAFPYLPRVRYGRTVLAPARWRTDEPFFEDAAVGDADWRRSLAAWCRAEDVPDRVQLADGDRYLDLDLSSAAHARLLRQERAKGHVLLYEVPGGSSAAGWLADEGGAYSHELVFPLTARPPYAAVGPRADGHLTSVHPEFAQPSAVHRADTPPPASARRPPLRRRGPGLVSHPPGTAWLYAKVYSSEQRQNEILTEHLPRLLQKTAANTDRWFFLRYRDPEPHLRIRLRAGKPEETGRLLPALGTWVQELRTEGVSGRTVLDTYDPEYERYGGAKGLEWAETVFQADSESVLVQLQSRSAGSIRLDPLLLVALNYLDILHHMNPAQHEHLGPRWLLETPPDHRERAVFRPHRRPAVRLTDLNGEWAALAAEPGGQLLVESWARRAQALQNYGTHLASAAADLRTPDPATDMVLGSLLHMHHNRLVGMDRVAERNSHAVARGAVQAIVDRRRHTR